MSGARLDAVANSDTLHSARKFKLADTVKLVTPRRRNVPDAVTVCALYMPPEEIAVSSEVLEELATYHRPWFMDANAAIAYRWTEEGATTLAVAALQWDDTGQTLCGFHNWRDSRYLQGESLWSFSMLQEVLREERRLRSVNGEPLDEYGFCHFRLK